MWKAKFQNLQEKKYRIFIWPVERKIFLKCNTERTHHSGKEFDCKLKTSDKCHPKHNKMTSHRLHARFLWLRVSFGTKGKLPSRQTDKTGSSLVRNTNRQWSYKKSEHQEFLARIWMEQHLFHRQWAGAISLQGNRKCPVKVQVHIFVPLQYAC